jgi:hypothetical protein
MHCRFEDQSCVCCGSRSPKLAKGVKLLRKCKAPCERLTPRVVAPNAGPGTELLLLLSSLGITEKPGCDCKAATMDAWGVDGCRERRDEIAGWLRENQDKFGWREKLAAVTAAVESGLVFSINVFDPFGSIVDEAIRRAGQAATASTDVYTVGIPQFPETHLDRTG